MIYDRDTPSIAEAMAGNAANDDEYGDDCLTDDECKASYEKLIQEYWWIEQFEGENVPYDGMQAALIRESKIEYNRHARAHNKRCPEYKVPLFLVNDPLR